MMPDAESRSPPALPATPRDAEIRDQRVAGLEQDVLRADVPVHYPLPMGVGQCLGDVAREAHGGGHRQASFPVEALPQDSPRTYGIT